MEANTISHHMMNYYKKPKLFTYRKISILEFIKSSLIFVNFALFNGLLPLFICLILSCIKPMGAQYTMAIGYITAIQLGFIQLSWSISVAILYAFFKQKKKVRLGDPSEFFMSFFVVTLIYSIIATIIFVGSSYAYNLYASKHINTLFGQKQAFYYIYTVWIYIFFNSFIYGFFVFIQIYQSAVKANILLFSYIAVLTALVALFTVVPNNALKVTADKSLVGIWCGLALSVGSIIYFMALCIYFKKKCEINFKFYKEYWANIRFILAKSHRQLLLIATIQIIKGIGLIALGFFIPDTINGIVPMFYQMSRVIWYNILYLIPFLGYGVSDSILFYGFYHQEEIDPRQLNKITITLFILVLAFELAFSVAVYQLITPLAKIYLTNIDAKESMSQYNINDIKLVPLIESLLKKESIRDVLGSKESIEEWLRNYVDKLDFSKIPNMKPEWIDFIKKYINLKIPNFAEFIFERSQRLLDPATRVEAINEVLDKLKEISGDTNLHIIKKIVALKLENPDVETIQKMFLVKDCNTYYFMVAWTTLYSCGLIFNSSKMVMRKNVYTWWQTALIILVQGIIISAVIAIGVTQQYSNALIMYDAWTMPLCLSGIIIFGYYLITYIVRYKKVTRNEEVQKIDLDVQYDYVFA